MISILIVDNDKVTRDILLRLLDFNFPDTILHVTARFESAMEMCRIFAVNIVITTTSIPPERCDDMIDALRSITFNPIKIIIMTPESRPYVLEKICSEPNTYVVSKPIDVNVLVELITSKIAELEDSNRNA